MLTICLLSLALGLASAQLGDPAVGTCMCLTTTGVNVRSSACGAVIGTANSPSCYQYLGTVTTCTLSGTSYDFYNVEYGSGGWIAGDYLSIGQDSQCQAPEGDWPWQAGTCSAVDIVTRAEWGARSPSCTLSTISNPVNYLFIHHTEGSSCTTQAACESVIQGIQNYHMDSNGWCDIGYSFLVGEDGRGYEGRGWAYVGAHTSGYNSVGHAISTMGSFTNARPNDAAMMAVQHLIDCCLDQGRLVSGFKLNGHRDTEATSCPGDAYYPEIQTWPYYCFDTPSASNPSRACSSRP